MSNYKEYAKAISGGVLAGLGALYLSLDDGSVSLQEWVGVAQASISAFAVVWGIPNAPKKDIVSQRTVTVSTTDVPGPDHRAERDDITGL